MKSTVFWDVTVCSPEECTASTSGLNMQSMEAAGRLLHLLFNPEDGRSVFLQNISELLLDQMVLHPTRLFTVTAVRTHILINPS
jgi:hypothetical protein